MFVMEKHIFEQQEVEADGLSQVEGSTRLPVFFIHSFIHFFLAHEWRVYHLWIKLREMKCRTRWVYLPVEMNVAGVNVYSWITQAMHYKQLSHISPQPYSLCTLFRIYFWDFWGCQCSSLIIMSIFFVVVDKSQKSNSNKKEKEKKKH